MISNINLYAILLPEPTKRALHFKTIHQFLFFVIADKMILSKSSFWAGIVKGKACLAKAI